MHLGLVCPEMAGHFNASLSLAQEVARRGHSVTVITSPCVREKVERAGLGFAPVGVKEEAEGVVRKRLDRLAKLRGSAALFYTGVLLAKASHVLFRDLPAILDHEDFDGLILDQVCPAAAVLSERRGLPYVVICNALPVHYDPVCPPPPTLWKYREDLLGRVRNRLLGWTLPPVYNLLTGATRVGVSPLMLCFEEPRHGLAHIAQQPAFFDFPRKGLPAYFHYSGPWHEPSRDRSVEFPWEWLDGRPLVYGSMGTIQNGIEQVYRAMADAVRELDVQLVIALGGVDRKLDIELPPNVLVVPFAPQLLLLERATAAITHAGYNTAIECLAQGVPMVCLPVTNDQPGVARRVEWLGAGEVLPIRRVNAQRLRALLQRVLREPSYREASLRCRDEIRKVNGLARAAAVIEQAFRTGQPVFRETQPNPASDRSIRIGRA